MITIGQRVRIVEMRGCMANVRHNPREGRVEDIESKTPYGAGAPMKFLNIRLDDGTPVSYPAASNLWTRHEGLMEYRDA